MSKLLFEALSAARRDMPTPKKTAVNPHFHARFAPLDEILACAAGPLAANGLVVVQAPRTNPAGALVLSTTVLHASGESLDCGEYPLSGATPQERGSAITYARRYVLQSVLSLAGEDDDDAERAQPQRQATPQPPKVAKAPAPPAPKKLTTEIVPPPKAPATQPNDLKTLMALMNEAGVSYGIDAKGKEREEAERVRRLAYLTQVCERDIASSKDLTPAEMTRAQAELRSWVKFVDIGRAAGLTSIEALMEVVQDRAGHPIANLMSQTDDEANNAVLFLRSITVKQ
jgi:hypothetical protein